MTISQLNSLTSVIPLPVLSCAMQEKAFSELGHGPWWDPSMIKHMHAWPHCDVQQYEAKTTAGKSIS